MNKKIRNVFFVLFAMFTALIIYIVYFTLVQAPVVINNPYNLRMDAKEASIKRGNIEDENGVVIAESVLESEETGYKRQYNYPYMYCHIAGYSSPGKTGVEGAYNANLLTLHNETLQRLLYILTNRVFKNGRFSLTGSAPFSETVRAADSVPSDGAFIFGGIDEDDGISGDDNEYTENYDEDYDENVGESESVSEETTEETSADELYEDSDIDSEIKNIYDDMGEGTGLGLEDIVSDGYRSENSFFAPLLDGYSLEGNSVVLSVDHRLQERAFELLGERKGSVVISDVNTGMIKAMVSYPNYNPETAAQNWSYLTTDEENSPLLNRASQGLYTPGSVFKIGMAQLIIDTGREDMTFVCEGINHFGNKTLRCYNENVHGTVGLKDAFKNSCNGFFAQAAIELGPERLITQARSLGYNRDLGFAAEHSDSIFSLTEDADTAELTDTGIGQGRTMVSPLHINMITAAVANGGTMYTPQIVKGLKSPAGRLIKEYSPKEDGTVMSPETAQKIKNLMRAVVLEGTAAAAADASVPIAGKTGTAENGTDSDHIWFTAFAPSDAPRYAVTVMLENAGRGGPAISMAKDLLEYACELE